MKMSKHLKMNYLYWMSWKNLNLGYWNWNYCYYSNCFENLNWTNLKNWMTNWNWKNYYSKMMMNWSYLIKKNLNCLKTKMTINYCLMKTSSKKTNWN